MGIRLNWLLPSEVVRAFIELHLSWLHYVVLLFLQLEYILVLISVVELLKIFALSQARHRDGVAT